MGGPVVEWKSGRVDVDPKKVKSDPETKKLVPPNGRLPDAAQGAQHVRDIFYRMGFDDREIVALLGAHAVGRCHSDRSGYDGPWTFTPTRFSNQFFVQLVRGEWKERKWNGPQQYEDKSKTLMMLPADLALIQDAKFKPYCELYAKDKNAFFNDFAKAFAKLLELGVKGGVATGCPRSRL